MSMKSTLPVIEWYGMRPPPEIRIVGFRDRYSKTRAPELIPLTICSKYNTFTDRIHKKYFTFVCFVRLSLVQTGLRCWPTT